MVIFTDLENRFVHSEVLECHDYFGSSEHAHYMLSAEGATKRFQSS